MAHVDSGKKRKLPSIDDVIRGTAVVMTRTCGKAGCRCGRGHKHKSIYISQYSKGAGRMIYIPKRNEKTVLRLIKNYRILKSAIGKASEINTIRFAASKRGKT